MVQVNITHLIDDVQYYQAVRALRWQMASRVPRVRANKSSSAAVMRQHLPVSVMRVILVTGALIT
jgi:hypothetical protein